MTDYPSRKSIHGAISEERRRNRVKGIRTDDIAGPANSDIERFGASSIVGDSGNPSYVNITRWVSVSDNLPISGPEDNFITVPSGTWLAFITVLADKNASESAFDTKMFGELMSTELVAVDMVKNGSRIVGQAIITGGTYQGQVGYDDAVDAADRSTELNVIGIRLGA